MRITVCTYPSRGEPLPGAFFLGERRLRVIAILSRWTQHPYQCFEVMAEDSRRFVLRVEPNTSCWELVAVHAAPAPAKKPAAKPHRFKLPFSDLLNAK